MASSGAESFLAKGDFFPFFFIFLLKVYEIVKKCNFVSGKGLADNYDKNEDDNLMELQSEGRLANWWKTVLFLIRHDVYTALDK